MPYSGLYDPLTAPPGDSTLELFYQSDGWSELWRGVHNGQWRIFKGLRKGYRDDFRYQELLRKEYEITHGLAHPGIRQVLDLVDLPGVGLCIEMEFVGGRSLKEALKEGELSRKEKRQIASELLDVVDYLHRRQIVHRDLSPANILITRDGGHVKLIDFELADSDALAILKERGGTNGYAAPELFSQEASSELCDCRSDIFSLGVILSEMGIAPAPVVRKCCAPGKEDRYRSIAGLRSAIVRHRLGKWLGVGMLVAALLSGLYFGSGYLFQK